MRFSWIMIFASIYFISLVLYLFVSETNFWDGYFIDVTLFKSIFLGLCIFTKNRSDKENMALLFIIIFSAFNVLYLIIGQGIGNTSWMEKHISFFTVIGFSAFFTWLFKRKKYEKVN